MYYSLLATAVVLLHFAFILFLIAGGLLVWRWQWMVWLHLPAALWGAGIELFGWTCPLTPLENSLRQAVGEAGYEGGFIEHYLLPIIYPEGWTSTIQIVAGLFVVGVNIAIYALLVHHRRSQRPSLLHTPK